MILTTKRNDDEAARGGRVYKAAMKEFTAVSFRSTDEEIARII